MVKRDFFDSKLNVFLFFLFLLICVFLLFESFYILEKTEVNRKVELDREVFEDYVEGLEKNDFLFDEFGECYLNDNFDFMCVESLSYKRAIDNREVFFCKFTQSRENECLYRTVFLQALTLEEVSYCEKILREDFEDKIEDCQIFYNENSLNHNSFDDLALEDDSLCLEFDEFGDKCILFEEDQK